MTAGNFESFSDKVYWKSAPVFMEKFTDNGERGELMGPIPIPKEKVINVITFNDNSLLRLKAAY